MSASGYGVLGYGVGPYGGNPLLAYDISYYQSLITSEYQANSPNFIAWVTALLQKLVDLSQVAELIPDAYDLDLAIGNQLDVLGLLRGVSRQLPFTPTSDTPVLTAAIQTTFNEGAAGTTIVGTHPAVDLPGVAWISSSGDATFQTGGGALFAAHSLILIKPGYTDFTITLGGVALTGPESQVFYFRMDDAITTGVVLTINADGSWSMVDVSPGTTGNTTLASGPAGDVPLHGAIALTFRGSQILGTMLGKPISCSSPIGSNTPLHSDFAVDTNGISSGVGTTRIASLEIDSTIYPPISSILGDEDFRTLLRARIAFNNWNGQVDALQPIWQSIFPGGSIVVVDEQNMTVSLIIAGAFTNLTKQMLAAGLIVPRPAAVLYNYVFASLPVLGFDADTQYIAGLDKGHFA